MGIELAPSRSRSRRQPEETDLYRALAQHLETLAENAAHLVDHVLPDVPIRQWVLSLPHTIRYLVGFDKELCRQLRGIFLRALLSFLQRRARDRGVETPRSGAVAVTQRFDSALRLDPHFHVAGLRSVWGTTKGAEVHHGPKGDPSHPDALGHADGTAARCTGAIPTASGLAIRVSMGKLRWGSDTGPPIAARSGSVRVPRRHGEPG